MPPRHRSSPPPPPPSSRPPPHERRRHHSSHPPPRHHHHHPHHHGGPRAGRQLALDAGPIDAALADVVPDSRDRAFVLRCILEEGPRHHRVASWALLRMLAAVLAEVGGHPEGNASTSEPLGMRLPPNVASASDDATFPIGVPTRMLREVLDPREAELALECLRDGPPHHALANAAMAWILEGVYERVRGRRSGSGE